MATRLIPSDGHDYTDGLGLPSPPVPSPGTPGEGNGGGSAQRTAGVTGSLPARALSQEPQPVVPSGAWAVGVSGGADSVALLALLWQRADLRLHIVHLDHQTRDGASAADARFVAELAVAWGLPATLATRQEVEASISIPLSPNRSTRFRQLRQALFQQVVDRHCLDGVVLAHHEQDQAETVLQRLLRGSGFAGLTGIAPDVMLGRLRVLHPLLDVPPQSLRSLLRARGIPWREDASNASPQYQRNRLRMLLSDRPTVGEALRELGSACATLRDWARGAAPVLAEVFETRHLRGVPDLLAQTAVRRWLVERGIPADAVAPAAVDRLILMARDAAAPARQCLPGRALARRRAGRIWIELPAVTNH